MFVATKQTHLDYLQTNQALQKSLGLTQARMVTRDEIVATVPQLRSDDILGGSFCPTDGFVDPYSVMVGFTTSRLRKGRDAVALDRGHGNPSRRLRYHRRRDHARAGEHAGRRECRGSVGRAGRGAGRNSTAGRADAPHADPDRTFRRRLA